MPSQHSLPEPQLLRASFEAWEQSYFITENRGHRSPVSDEALVQIAGRIVQISSALSVHEGEPIDITLACSLAYPADESVPVRDTPALLSLNLSKRQRSLMAYLPVAAFWSIASLIEKGRITHLEAGFARVRYGSGDLQSLHLLTQRQAVALLAQPVTTPTT